MIQVRKNSITKRLAKGIMALSAICLSAMPLFTSCSETSNEVEEYPQWQATNAAKWNSIYAEASAKIAAGDTSWKIIRSWSLEDTLHVDNTSYIVVHVIKSGTGTVSPLYTDYVSVNYRGTLLPSTSYPSGYEFDSSWHQATSETTTAPALMQVSATKDGFSTALQHMHVGDQWMVYMPWTLAYGNTGSGKIPPYSVLTFDMQLVSIHPAGSTLPDFSAKANASLTAE